MTERQPETAYKQRAGDVIEEATRAYFKLASQDNVAPINRLNSIIACEEAHQFAKVMGLPKPDLVRAHLKGIPEPYRQDYLEIIYDSGIVDSNEADSIAREFGFIRPLVLSSLHYFSLFTSRP